MQFRRIMKVIMTHHYWIIGGPSLALNPCKKYQIIYESVHSYLCKCTRNKYPCKSTSEFVWNVPIQVVLKVISFSILNMYELVKTWFQRHSFGSSQMDSQMHTFHSAASTYGALKTRKLAMKSVGIKWGKPDHILISTKNVSSICGKNILLPVYVNQKCKHSIIKLKLTSIDLHIRILRNSC